MQEKEFDDYMRQRDARRAKWSPDILSNIAAEVDKLQPDEPITLALGDYVTFLGSKESRSSDDVIGKVVNINSISQDNCYGVIRYGATMCGAWHSRSCFKFVRRADAESILSLALGDREEYPDDFGDDTDDTDLENDLESDDGNM